MKTIIIIEADTNDGDYTYAINEITEEVLESLADTITAVKEKKHYNWCLGESCSDEDNPEDMYEDVDGFNFDLFQQFVPCGEHGVHTITSIRILNVEKDLELM